MAFLSHTSVRKSRYDLRAIEGIARYPPATRTRIDQERRRLDQATRVVSVDVLARQHLVLPLVRERDPIRAVCVAETIGLRDWRSGHPMVRQYGDFIFIKGIWVSFDRKFVAWIRR